MRQILEVHIPEPHVFKLSEWLERLKELKALHGDVMFGVTTGEDLGSLPQIEFFVEVNS